MSIWEFCIRRPVFTITLIVTMLAFGVLGYTRMGIDLYPRIEPPVVAVSTILQGASPEVMDQDVTRVIEEQVGTLEGVEVITSTSSESRSDVTIQFKLSRDLDAAAQEVRDRVGVAALRLPPDIEPPIVQKIDPDAQAVMWLSVSGNGPYRELSYYSEKVIKERLQTQPGVGAVELGGFQKKAIRVWVDPDRLRSFRLGPADVVNALQAWQLELPGGRTETEVSESTIKVEGEYKTIEGLASLIVKQENGALVRLSDLSQVEDGLEDLRGACRYNEKQSIGLGILKQSGGNTVAVCEAVKAALPEIREQIPDWIHVDVAYDASPSIRASIEGVQFDVLFGALFTCLVIGLFLRDWRSTLISVLAIPTSLVSYFFLAERLGFTINQMTMLGMSLAVGLVIDDAIVVIESIHRRLDLGDDAFEAARRGTGEVAFAVIAATLAIGAIFLPITFISGVIGQFFIPFGLTVAVTILLSLVVSLTLTPMLGARLMRKEATEGWLARALAWPVETLEALYRRVLAISIHNLFTRLVTLAIALAIFVLSLGAASRLGTEFMPATDSGNFLVFFKTPLGSSLELTSRRIEAAEKIVLGRKEVEGAFMAIGLFDGQPNSGLFFATLVPREKRDKSQQELMSELRGQLADIPGLQSFVVANDPLLVGAGATRSTDIAYVMLGPDLADLERFSDAIKQKMIESGSFVDVDDDLELSRPQVDVELNREAAADLGLNTRDISLAVQVMMGGLNAAKFQEGGDRYDIRVKARDSFRLTSDNIGRIAVRTPGGGMMDLASVLSVRDGLGPNQINRYNQQRSVTISANVKGIAAGEGTEKFLAICHQVIEGNPQYSLVPTGQSKLFREAAAYLGFAFIMAFLVVYGVLAMQFESFVHPFTVMLTVPLATIGVFFALFVTGATVNVYSFIGVIMLSGIVTRNAILLIDRINQRRDLGQDLRAAVLEAGPIRLRPILMTSIAAAVGILPVALGLSEGGEARAPMGIAVIGGLCTSTFLTLFVIPCVYMLLDFLGGKRSHSRA